MIDGTGNLLPTHFSVTRRPSSMRRDKTSFVLAAEFRMVNCLQFQVSINYFQIPFECGFGYFWLMPSISSSQGLSRTVTLFSILISKYQTFVFTLNGHFFNNDFCLKWWFVTCDSCKLVIVKQDIQIYRNCSRIEEQPFSSSINRHRLIKRLQPVS